MNTINKPELQEFIFDLSGRHVEATKPILIDRLRALLDQRNYRGHNNETSIRNYIRSIKQDREREEEEKWKIREEETEEESNEKEKEIAEEPLATCDDSLNIDIDEITSMQ
jgi:Ran GTPase-activating protein (RanGAP) involved in mRNA processing and transport